MNEFDYIVVGAGSAGCVVASRLSEEPGTSVLLLEAGGKDDRLTIAMPLAFLKTLFDPTLSWGDMSEPEPHLGGRRLWLPRGKVLGGSSSINGMFYMRGHPNDFDTWARLGARGWSYADVLPYFRAGRQLARRQRISWRGRPAARRADADGASAARAAAAGGSGGGISATDDITALCRRPGAGELTKTAWPAGQRGGGYIHPALGRRISVRLNALAIASCSTGGRRYQYSVDGDAAGASAAGSHPELRRLQFAAVAHALRHRPGGASAARESR
jgi:choline dehydrogenase